MTVLVILAAAAASAFLLWFFFGPRRVHEAAVEASVQRATIVVAGGYTPNLIQARQGFIGLGLITFARIMPISAGMRADLEGTV